MDRRFGGIKAVVLENDFVRLVVLADKGSDIVELVHKRKGVDVMWHSPLGHRPRSDSALLFPTSETGFLDGYGGGWQDLLPTIGSGPTDLHGAKFGLHGETGVLPWDATVETSAEKAEAHFRVTGVRYPYSVEKTVALGLQAEIQISEKLTNTSKQELEFYWLQHPAFGEPFLAPGCVLDLPKGSRVVNLESINSRGRVAEGEFDWPHVKSKSGESIDLSVIPPKTVVAEESTFIRVKEGWYSFTNPALGLRVRFEWDTSTFPWLWFWQNYWTPDYPFFGTAWNVAIEPASSLPTTLEKESARGAIVLGPGQSRTTRITVRLEEA